MSSTPPRKPPKTVLVTVGATFPFPKLTLAALSPPVQRTLLAHNFTHIILQHGLPASSSDPAITAVTATLPPNTPPTPHLLAVESHSFLPSLHTHISSADLIISHAGSGTILDVLRMGKRLIVVPNPELMDGHQQELARELQSQGYLVEGSAEEEGLSGAIERAMGMFLKGFPKPEGGAFAQVVDQEVGLGSEITQLD
ncbi:glycosyltransferase family 28 C-terminal domain-containing protein [Peziza echinospora]|nr:glycosyltransferase family 28 C-terminal domain-containing protein [Peziza echinospora]